MTRSRRFHVLQVIACCLVIVGCGRDLHTIHSNRQAMMSSTASGSVSPSARAPILVYHDSESESARLLSELGFKQELMAVVIRLFFHPVAFVVIVVLLVFAALVGDLVLAKRQMQLNLGSVVLAMSVLLAVFQWHASLEQDAMQKYEQEAGTANAAESSPAVARMLGHFYIGKTPDDYAKSRYVYIHLDNLEYALERYRQGFASATTTERALMTFAVHCKEPEFRLLVEQQVTGYSQDVRVVVAAVLRNI